MGRKRTRAGRVAEIAKAAVLQGLLPLLGIWFTLAFRETITIGRKRLGICRHHCPPPGSKPKLTGQASGLGRLARFALMDRQTQKKPRLGAVADQDMVLGKGFEFGAAPGAIGTGRERGRRRTRQDQISTKLAAR